MMKKSALRLFSVSLTLALALTVIPSLSATLANEAPKTETKTVNDFKVTLLGTGTPLLSMKRFGPATLVEAGGEKLLFDAGRGAALRMSQVNVQPGEITKLFLTHLHSDHTVGLPDVWLTGTLTTTGHRSTEFEVWGPAGTKKMMEDLEKAYKPDIDTRIENGYIVPEGAKPIGHDIKQGVVYEKNGVQVVAFQVDHDIDPSFGYRINYKGHSVVLSGDTTYNENVIQHGKAADLLIHEVAVAKPEDLVSIPAFQKILSVHTTPEQAGKVFSQTKPKLAVYSHIVLLGDMSEASAHLLYRTQSTYDGKVIVGEDLMTFEIGEEVNITER
ncbi:MBL fold metallo-hydrolase [Brevibacillus nitrificans]|uniref:MBL fold metallo-hydrolase n=1 Tax=Brevibacillus nitrificans TaxID=651560 RepID=UPI00261D3E02|nr:MBL fold metallo-hydrolase [Brevibacillus nitrificans]